MPFDYLDISFNFFTKLDQSDEASHVLKYLRYLNISANRIEAVDFTHLTVEHLETLVTSKLNLDTQQ